MSNNPHALSLSNVVLKLSYFGSDTGPKGTVECVASGDLGPGGVELGALNPDGSFVSISKTRVPQSQAGKVVSLPLDGASLAYFLALGPLRMAIRRADNQEMSPAVTSITPQPAQLVSPIITDAIVSDRTVTLSGTTVHSGAKIEATVGGKSACVVLPANPVGGRPWSVSVPDVPQGSHTASVTVIDPLEKGTPLFRTSAPATKGNITVPEKIIIQDK